MDLDNKICLKEPSTLISFGINIIPFTFLEDDERLLVNEHKPLAAVINLTLIYMYRYKILERYSPVLFIGTSSLWTDEHHIYVEYLVGDPKGYREVNADFPLKDYGVYWGFRYEL